MCEFPESGVGVWAASIKIARVEFKQGGLREGLPLCPVLFSTMRHCSTRAGWLPATPDQDASRSSARMTVQPRPRMLQIKDWPNFLRMEWIGTSIPLLSTSLPQPYIRSSSWPREKIEPGLSINVCTRANSRAESAEATRLLCTRSRSQSCAATMHARVQEVREHRRA
jgi:hypothetical protein